MLLALASSLLDPGFELLVSSQGVSQGLQQSRGAQLIPRLFVTSGKVQAGLLWRNIDSPLANGVGILFARYSATVSKADVSAFVRYRVRTGDRSDHPTAWEFAVTGRKSLGAVSLQGVAEFSPDEFGRGRSLYVEAGPGLAFGTARISANLGWRTRQGDPDYASMNAGLATTMGKYVLVDARYYATNKSEIGLRYRNRFVLSARLSL